MAKATVFIDGNNFYFRLKDATSSQRRVSLLDFDYTKFCTDLVRPNALVQIRYYIGALRRQKGNQKSEEMYANQQKLLAKLQRHNVHVTLGQLIQHPDKSYHEKGVDVRLAVEMIARALATDADTILFDEPFTGLFPEMVKTVSGIIKELRVGEKTVVLIEHDMAIIRELCDRVIVLEAGRLLAEGKPEEVLKEPKVIEAYLGA